ncbi:rod shape-determining protein MreD [Lysinibacillus alkalisoli]|nr:rod shape-determining protein MreD [Lysinibacillus alkalisoli]
MRRFLVVAAVALLFLLEPGFAFLSPLQLGDNVYYFVPRFVIVSLIFLATFHSKKRAILIGLFFGVLYDVFYINIIGLYAFVYPFLAFLAGTIMRYIRPNMIVTSIVSLLLVTVMEVILYQFYHYIGFTTMPWASFIQHRLLPTMLTNTLFTILMAIVFVYLINKRWIRNEMDTV